MTTLPELKQAQRSIDWAIAEMSRKPGYCVDAVFTHMRAAKALIDSCVEGYGQSASTLPRMFVAEVEREAPAEAEPAASEGEDDDTPCVECGGPIAVEGTVNCLCCAIDKPKAKEEPDSQFVQTGNMAVYMPTPRSRRDEFVKIAFDRLLRKHIKGALIEPEEFDKLAAMIASSSINLANAMERQLAVTPVTEWAVAK